MHSPTGGWTSAAVGSPRAGPSRLARLAADANRAEAATGSPLFLRFCVDTPISGWQRPRKATPKCTLWTDLAARPQVGLSCTGWEDSCSVVFFRSYLQRF